MHENTSEFKLHCIYNYLTIKKKYFYKFKTNIHVTNENLVSIKKELGSLYVVFLMYVTLYYF